MVSIKEKIIMRMASVILILFPLFLSSCKQETMAEYSIENKATQAYMQFGSYPEFGAPSYWDTHKDVLTLDLCLGQDEPEPISISWSGNGAASYSIRLSEKKCCSKPVLTTTTENTSFSFVNLIPGKTYKYKVEADGKTMTKGAFRTTGQVRMIRLSESWNARDCGGWTGLGGKQVEYGKIYRCGSLNGKWTGGEPDTLNVGIPELYVMGDKMKEELAEVGIKAELDIRGKDWEGEWGNEKNLHSRSLLHPKFDIPEEDYLQKMTDGAIMRPLSYYAIVQDIAFIIEKVLEGKPVAFHCRSGADRTGIVGMTLDALLGVAPGDAARNYELTTLSKEKVVINGLKKFQIRTASRAGIGFVNGFTTLGVPSDEGAGLFQAQAYYYLNQYFKDHPADDGATPCINASDLDSFIKIMLGMSDREYSAYRHPWAVEYGSDNTLRSIYTPVQPYTKQF